MPNCPGECLALPPMSPRRDPESPGISRPQRVESHALLLLWRSRHPEDARFFSRRWRPVATIIAAGVASPSAQGQAIISTNKTPTTESYTLAPHDAQHNHPAHAAI